MAVDTLIGIFLDTVSAHQNPAQFMRKTAQGWEAISAERAESDVENLALALRQLGVRKDDKVALLSENRYEWPLVDLAVLGLGAVTVPIYPTLTPLQVRYIVENSEASIAVVSNAVQLDKMLEAVAGLPQLTAVIHMDPAPARPRAHALEALIEEGRTQRRQNPGAFRESAGAVRSDDLATIIYTSGTTGEPKGAMLTHGNIASNVWACRRVIDLFPADRCLSFLPLCHIFERMAGLYAMLSAGMTIAYAESIDAVAANAVEVRPTVLCGVPRFYEKVYARVMDNARTLPSLRRRIFHWGLQVGTKTAQARFERRALDPLATFRAWLADRLVG
ncbi:MAG TPA: AMP-binding protein, partial [Candidatus Eisenbacteria bacterium]